ncbi:hypothetical protein GCM10009808_01450 [Microbacterium sediminicola]|uniref:Amidohydrolase 3 domain-containing protein n=1 Tax=Microbacterium sediminicola TaxID=415210 RepID=A0ABN2HHU4_9MICO
MDTTSYDSSAVLVGDIITMDHDAPRAEALAHRDGRIVAIGSLDEVRASVPTGTPETAARGTVVPGFIDSHFYLQRGGLKSLDLFPDHEPTPAEYRERMLETALDPDWNGPSAPTAADRRAGLRRVQPLLHAFGITGIVDPWATTETVRVYQQAHAAGELTMRVTAMPYFEGLRDHLVTPESVMDALGGVGIGSGFGDDTLAFGCVKVYADGEGKRQQALRETPWPATGELGIRAIEPDELERIATFCAQNGWALGVHAIGGGAMRMAIDVFERVDAHTPLAGLRFRLIHAYLEPAPDVIARAARLGVLLSAQPAIQWSNAAWLTDVLGPDAASTNPLRDWTDAGVRIALGSDGPYFPFDPLEVMRFTRTRESRGSDAPIGPDQRLTATEALAGYTRDAAFAALVDARRGILRPGLLADWAELSLDPLAAPDAALADGEALRTVIGGRVVFDAT